MGPESRLDLDLIRRSIQNVPVVVVEDQPVVPNQGRDKLVVVDLQPGQEQDVRLFIAKLVAMSRVQGVTHFPQRTHEHLAVGVLPAIAAWAWSTVAAERAQILAIPRGEQAIVVAHQGGVVDIHSPDVGDALADPAEIVGGPVNEVGPVAFLVGDHRAVGQVRMHHALTVGPVEVDRAAEAQDAGPEPGEFGVVDIHVGEHLEIHGRIGRVHAPYPLPHAIDLHEGVGLGRDVLERARVKGCRPRGPWRESDGLRVVRPELGLHPGIRTREGESDVDRIGPRSRDREVAVLVRSGVPSRTGDLHERHDLDDRWVRRGVRQVVMLRIGRSGVPFDVAYDVIRHGTVMDQLLIAQDFGRLPIGRDIDLPACGDLSGSSEIVDLHRPGQPRSKPRTVLVRVDDQLGVRDHRRRPALQSLELLLRRGERQNRGQRRLHRHRLQTGQAGRVHGQEFGLRTEENRNGASNHGYAADHLVEDDGGLVARADPSHRQVLDVAQLQGGLGDPEQGPDVLYPAPGEVFPLLVRGGENRRLRPAAEEKLAGEGPRVGAENPLRAVQGLPGIQIGVECRTTLASLEPRHDREEKQSCGREHGDREDKGEVGIRHSLSAPPQSNSGFAS